MRIKSSQSLKSFKAEAIIQVVMGKLNPHTKTLDSNPSPGAEEAALIVL
jgi:hypothetical protein